MQNLTIHQRGYRRDEAIKEQIELCGVLDTEQLRLLLFKDVSIRVIQRRLKVLYDRKELRRDRLNPGEPYYYYTGKHPGQVEHTLGLNWYCVWAITGLRNWEKFHSYERETDYGILRSDGFIALKNTVRNTFSFSFVEMDIAESGNRFDKVERYNKLYESGNYTGHWWAGLAERFPAVVIVTTGSVMRIQERIARENRNGLEFKVFPLQGVKEACLNGSGSFSSLRAK